MPQVLLLALFLTIFQRACAQDPHVYDLESPQQSWVLPATLNEISGLTWDPTGQFLLTVQDELGVVYFIDPHTGAIAREVPFWNEGDYEGIETVGDEVYVLKNTGTLYRIIGIGTPEQEVIKYNGFLSDDYNLEGLAYDAAGNRLLLACKADPEEKPQRFIFAFDLAGHTFGQEPVLRIERAAFDQLLAERPTGLHHKFYERFAPEEEELDFHPSALAIHPLTGNYYVASGNGRMLMIMDPNGRILDLIRLDKDFLRQLEGICFAPDGTIYLSSERKDDDPAVIHVYPYLTRERP